MGRPPLGLLTLAAAVNHEGHEGLNSRYLREHRDHRGWHGHSDPTSADAPGCKTVVVRCDDMARTVTVRLNQRQQKVLADAVRREGKSVSAIIREALDRTLTERPRSHAPATSRAACVSHVPSAPPRGEMPSASATGDRDEMAHRHGFTDRLFTTSAVITDYLFPPSR